MKPSILYFSLAILFFSACAEQAPRSDAYPKLVNNNPYWYSGEAEVSSYELSQARYGEIHEGKAVLVYVTEPFSTEKNTKSDTPSAKDISVLKLNATKKFNTGIYPYSMMTSTFFPFENGKHSLKISSSSQEWCGHTYMEMRNKRKFEIDIHSYFEGESDKNISLDKNVLEDDIWSMIRLAPNDLPKGELTIIPSFFYLRLMHKDLKAYSCKATNRANGETSSYRLDYPELDRSLTIQYETKAPHKILGWTESYTSGFGANRKKLTTEAKRIETIKTAYWGKHSNNDRALRTKLGLD